MMDRLIDACIAVVMVFGTLLLSICCLAGIAMIAVPAICFISKMIF